MSRVILLREAREDVLEAFRWYETERRGLGREEVPSTYGGSPPHGDEWHLDVIAERLAAVDRGEGSARPWEAVRKDLLARLCETSR